MISLVEFSELTTTLFSAAMGQVSWEFFLEELSIKAGGICTHILGFDQESDVAIDFATAGIDPDFMKTYHEYYAALNAWAPGLASQPTGVAVDCEIMCPTEQLLKTEFYQDWLRPQDDIIQGGGTLLFNSETSCFLLGGTIRLRDADKLKGEWLQLVDQLIPHLQQAFEISRALAGSKLETAIVASHGLRDIPAIVMLSESGHILFANTVAQTMIAKGRPISCDLSSTLTFGKGLQSRKISRDFLRYRLSAGVPSFCVELPKDTEGRFYQLRFYKLAPDVQITFPLDAKLGFSDRCILLLVTEERPATDLAAHLQARSGLTKAEAQVATALVEGMTSRQISEYREASIHTVRHQIKSAMAKVGVHRQADLVREIQRLAASHSPFG